jgi:hypothetical protein
LTPGKHAGRTHPVQAANWTILIISTFVILTIAVGGGEIFAFNPLQIN